MHVNDLNRSGSDSRSRSHSRNKGLFKNDSNMDVKELKKDYEQLMFK